MKKSFFLLVLLCLFVIVYACKEQEALDQSVSTPTPTAQNESPKTNSLAGPNLTKAQYLQLSPDDQKQVWVDKLQYILGQQLTDATQTQLIQQLIQHLLAQSTGQFTMTNAMDAIRLDLIDACSETDYVQTFATLDYNTWQGNDGTTCTQCIHIPTGTGGVAGLPDCNCDWTCGDPLASYSCSALESASCCNITTSGCGFIWAFPCIGLDVL